MSDPSRKRIGFGIQVPQTDYQAVKVHWLEAQRLGYDSCWLDDHLFSTYVGGWQQPEGECYSWLGGLAEATSTVRLGTLVGCNSYRSPALLAKIIASLDQVSSGRMEFAIGAGWFQKEYEAFGYDFPRPGVRLDMLGETLEIYKRMMTEELPSFEGKYYHIKEALTRPGPVQKPHPPIWIGGGGEKKTLRLVAKYADKWNAPGSVDDFARKLKILEGYCEEIGRDVNKIEKTWFGSLFIDEDASRLRAHVEMRAKAVNMTVDEFTSRRMAGTPDQIVAKMKEYIDLGITYFIPMLDDASDIQSTRLIAQEVMPAFR